MQFLHNNIFYFEYHKVVYDFYKNKNIILVK